MYVSLAIAALTSGQRLGLAALGFGSLAVAGVFIAVRGRQTLVAHEAQNIGLRSRMGQLQWDFAGSFATNITVIGSVLTIILTSNALPARTAIFPADTYFALGVFFGVLVVVAPLLYNGTVTRVKVAPDDIDTAAEYHGTVWGFLLAASVTTWGLLGSVATSALLFVELRDAGSLPLAVVILLGVGFALAVVFCARYLWVRVDGTIVNEFDPTAISARKARSTAFRAAEPNSLPAPTDEHPPPSPRLTVL